MLKKEIDRDRERKNIIGSERKRGERRLIDN